MDFVSYSLENEQQFWDELDEIVKRPCDNQHAIDSALKAYLTFVANYAHQYLRSDYDWAKCAFKLLGAQLFRLHKNYVRRRMFGRLRKEQSTPRLQLVAIILLYDGRESSRVFEHMLDEGLFVRLVDLVREKKEQDPIMWRVFLDLLYEMSRIQRVRHEDLDAIDDEFVKYLFQLVEEDPEDLDNDPYHYPVIRMLLVLNEQYMVSTHTTPSSGRSLDNGPTNKIIKILCYHGTDYRTFGENIVLLINRESETCLQLLILKLLYLLFTTTATYEYFYSNDLRVLVDVIIRNLLDLPDEALSLRHTYLRVLYPLLNHTQLRKAPHYKREELLELFMTLSDAGSAHFAPPDPTTIRLVSRCLTVPWLKPVIEEGPVNPAHRFLGMTLARQGESSISVVEMAAQSEKPGVMLPSRTRDDPNNVAADLNANATGGYEIAGEA
ncbi:hypothetical protein FN846DRAFT_993261 [Sphaerosporella brunnea]|uniref:SPIN90/Ldb17 leucine-rich domain-containing protein n=1 Tax=Sphaerosporella brunnea TaxID=1250544 RepID=A0A5J5ENF7_9PEZI|nr:hypothetical protein FN846DRAFT_993261 [Sphaerosporella brunnea]